MLARRLNTAPFSFFDDFFNDSIWKENDLNDVNINHSYYSGLEYKKNENGIDVKMMVPGYGKEDIELSIEGNILTISSKEEKPIVFQKLKIPGDIDIDKAKSTCNKGILTIMAPLINPPKKEKKLLKIT